MKHKFSNAGENFLQRRYGVRLGRRYVLAAASVVLMGVIGCSQVNSSTSAFAQSGSPRSESPVSKPALNPDSKLITANTKFGFKLFSEVLKNDSGKNIFVSPSSVAIALAMTYNGASGSTKEAMAKALEFKELNLEQINSSNVVLKKLLENSDPKVQLTIANSLWGNRKASFQPDFLQRNRDFYTAKIASLNFTDASSLNVINDWVNQNTSGKITNIVEKIQPDQVLFLINAIYFKGSWTNEFDKQQTAEYPFYLQSGEQKQHPMMSQSGDYRYFENQQFQAVSLPYGKDAKMSFYIFLPKQNSNLQSFYQNLNAENWENWMAQFSKQQGSIRLPRFKMNYDVTLKNPLTAIGMGEAFSDQANFSAMGKDLKISEVKHKTFVEVNEEGTEAAAATSVQMVPLSALLPPKEPFQMIVERPFFCAIRDNQTGSILFMGSIVEPQS
ncbi:serpin family protein [Brasilonema octagenarum UFV-E1]|uniref:Serpin family protein n=1 Tax=Brasilonema sennae CENA114 TaxID=415709 RepID=A0A856MF86_9CYAN|nr:serpin family protein [Brasilonema sennae]QDL07727.1 serpin family protein [Brasilonema sennae CENA114]QDL14089.1 serpin family protein [Brasilonema octagenarum UFV-E1]